MKIGQLAKDTRTTPATIRYYEAIGLLPPALRQEGSQRVYAERDRSRLNFIRRCREFDFPLETVRVLASLIQDEARPCVEARDLAAEHLADVQRKLRDLTELEHEIRGFVEACSNSCVTGTTNNCIIISQLSVIIPPKPAGTGCCGSATPSAQPSP